MRVIDIINISAIIVSPVVAVIVGQILQDRRKKRSDKMEIFKTLMISRGLGWSTESVKALNIIEVVFSDDHSVLNQWKIYYDRSRIQMKQSFLKLRQKEINFLILWRNRWDIKRMSHGRLYRNHIFLRDYRIILFNSSNIKTHNWI